MNTSVNQCLRASALVLLFGLSACGGGGSQSGSSTPDPIAQLPGTLVDPVNYSSSANAALSSAVETSANTSHSITLNGTTIPYTAKAGHLTAKATGTGQDQASFFYVAYTADNVPAASRPITFFYNGGPGSASVWLHLGSYGPKRLVTGMPSTSLARPFALIDNAESLLDTSDLVFVDAVGSGLSQAIAPFTNRSFWSVDADAAVFRDFVQCYLTVNARQASPKYLFGESYGGPRTAVLAALLESAGVQLTGLVLQAPVLNYNSNCGLIGQATVSCGGYLPSYAATGQYHRLSRPSVSDLSAHLAQVRDFSAQRYTPAVQALFAGGVLPVELPQLLSDMTGLALSHWRSNFNMQASLFRNQLIPGSLIGRYDARVSAPVGSALASEGDPSSTLISASFSSAISAYLRDTLRYRNASTYVLSSNAIEIWDFRHAGKNLPDTVPDLGAALVLNPQLRVLALNGYHDLATPFYQTELDLARLNLPARVLLRNYAGGHMTYLDDAARVVSKTDLQAFYRGTLKGTQVNIQGEMASVLAAPPSFTEIGINSVPSTEALQTPLRDPWIPPALRPLVPPPPPSEGQVLRREIEARTRDLRQRVGGK
ncbi:peptidase S10 [Undibacterium seohonense]|uniref:Peptidase S10 n=1 Tax=Undibacterium seohonense TaxID=1344950 RepID=A0ABR6X2Q4_9BURK|nr:peptidase S10 [Undibacterium seohonense]MBC3806918.1 peptidase S10 [Undibacterium seohonense]